MTKKELAAEVAQLRAEVAALRNALATRPYVQPVPYPVPYYPNRYPYVTYTSGGYIAPAGDSSKTVTINLSGDATATAREVERAMVKRRRAAGRS